MPIYEYSDNKLQPLKPTTFSEEKIFERKHLQAALREKIEVIAPDCLVISEEFSEWSDSQRRIDLLAIDKAANIVVIELKRNETGEHMELQALRYSAMVSTLTFRKAVDIYQDFITKNDLNLNAEEDILNFLDWEEPQEEDFAQDVRIILVAADFSKELTTTVIWLNERNLDIKCIRFMPVKYEGKVLLDIQQIIPLPEAESFQVKIRQKNEEQREARKSNKDYTKYVFLNNEYNKRNLVFAVITHWLGTHKPTSITELTEAFPQNIRSGNMFLPVERAREIYASHKIPRHFLNDNELISFSSGEKYAISNQWGKTNIEKFLAAARRLGFEIKET